MNAALVVIDVQRSLVDYLGKERRAEYLPVLAALIERARTQNVPVVYVRHNDEELVHGSSGWQIAGEIGPQAGEPIVDKTFRDSFRETNLADVLAALDADRLVLCGMQTEFCVDATLREAVRRGYRVTLVADGTATYPDGGASEEQIQAQVHRVASGIASITPSSQLFV